MSRFTDQIATVAEQSRLGLHFGTADCLRFKSWRDIHRTAATVAAHLSAEGVTHGGRVAVLAANPDDVAEVVQGIWRLGAAMTMLQQPTSQADLADWLSATMSALAMLDAQCVVVGEPFSMAAAPLRASGCRVLEIPSQWPDCGTALGATAELPGEADMALYQLTSGSTGIPKAVAITHRNLYANVVSMIAEVKLNPHLDVTMSWLPLSHDMGLIAYLLAPMFSGIRAVNIAPTEFVRSPLNWIRVLSEQRATVTAAPNFAYSIVSRRLRAAEDLSYDLSSLRCVVSGAEPIDPETMLEFARQAGRFGMPASAIGAAYGLAEATVAVSFSPVDEQLSFDIVSSEELENRGLAVSAEGIGATPKHLAVLGRPVGGMEVRITDRDGSAQSPRRMGEIAIRGEAVTQHYLTVDGEVAAVDRDGWLATGDLGYLTDDGQIVVCGRLKNVIIVAGRNIFPADIERLVASAEGVRSGGVAAFGVTLPDRREEIRIVAETVASYSDEVCRNIRRQIAQRVRGATGLSPTVFLVGKGAVPKTASGKIRHIAVREMFGEVAAL